MKPFLTRSYSSLAFAFTLLLASFQAISQTVYDEERELVKLTNKVRTQPQHFLNMTLKPYLLKKGIDTLNNRYAASLVTDLRKQSSAAPLIRSSYLTRKARLFAKDMGAMGAVGHSSKKLGNLSNRLRRYRNGYIGENCSYGYSNALDILMQLLIDEDVPSLGHRKNILNPKFSRVGVAIEGHKRYIWNCVMDFGG